MAHESFNALTYQEKNSIKAKDTTMVKTSKPIEIIISLINPSPNNKMDTTKTFKYMKMLSTSGSTTVNAGFNMSCRLVGGIIFIDPLCTEGVERGTQLSTLECLVTEDWITKGDRCSYMISNRWNCFDKRDSVIKHALVGKFGDSVQFVGPNPVQEESL